MTKKRIKRTKIWALWSVIVLVGILAVSGVIYAYTNGSAGQPTTIIENAGDITINNPEQPMALIDEGEADLGANLFPNPRCVSEDCVYVAAGKFQDATTTIIGFANYWRMATTSPNQVVIENSTDNGFGYTSATSTVELVNLNITSNATSTYSVVCGAAASRYATSSINILYAIDIATSTIGNATSTNIGVLTNNIASTTAASYGLKNTGGIDKIYLTPQYPYFTCKAYSDYTNWSNSADNAFINAANVFDGTFAVRISKPR